MGKFRFFKKNLQTKGVKKANCTELKTLLNEEDANVDQTKFTKALKGAATSNTNDKILMMMKLRSMISTKKLEKTDDKKTTHITLPLKNGTESASKLLDKATKLLTKYGWPDQNQATTEAVSAFITAYGTLGKRHIPKATILISSMHTPLQWAKLTFKTDQRPTKRDEVRALLKFIKAHPIQEDSDIIGAIINKNKKNTECKDKDYRVYTLHVTQFISNVNKTPGVLLPTAFQTALNSYNGPKNNAFQSGLRAYGNKEIEEYNKALKQLMEEGTIAGTYPAQTSDERLTDYLKTYENNQLTNAQATFQKNLDYISTAMDALLDPSNTPTKQIDAESLKLNKHGLSPYPHKGEANITLNKTKIFLGQMLSLLHDSKYDACIEMLTPGTLQDDWRLCFTTYIQNRKKAQQTPSEQWEIFCSEINYMPKSQRNLENNVNDCLTHPDFGGLKDAFKSLGTAFSKTGAARTAQINAAKKQIPDNIKNIHKQDIEKIFDKLMESSSAPTREDNSAPKPAPAATSSATTKADGSNGFAGAQTGNFFTINTPKK